MRRFVIDHVALRQDLSDRVSPAGLSVGLLEPSEVLRQVDFQTHLSLKDTEDVVSGKGD